MLRRYDENDIETESLLMMDQSQVDSPRGNQQQYRPSHEKLGDGVIGQTSVRKEGDSQNQGANKSKSH